MLTTKKKKKKNIVNSMWALQCFRDRDKSFHEFMNVIALM